MTSVVFFETEQGLKGFEISGHSGAGESGYDIVCSAISSAAIMAANTLSEILQLDVNQKVEEGYLYIEVSQILKAQDILRGLELHLKELQAQYPQNLTVSYRRKK